MLSSVFSDSIQRREPDRMATLTIRNVDDDVKDRLRIRAARHRRSLEAELRAIISEAAGAENHGEMNLAEAIHRRFAPFGGVDDLPSHPMVSASKPPEFKS
jgi:plasmid stability protein